MPLQPRYLWHAGALKTKLNPRSKISEEGLRAEIGQKCPCHSAGM